MSNLALLVSICLYLPFQCYGLVSLDPGVLDPKRNYFGQKQSGKGKAFVKATEGLLEYITPAVTATEAVSQYWFWQKSVATFEHGAVFMELKPNDQPSAWNVLVKLLAAFGKPVDANVDLAMHGAITLADMSDEQLVGMLADAENDPVGAIIKVLGHFEQPGLAHAVACMEMLLREFDNPKEMLLIGDGSSVSATIGQLANKHKDDIENVIQSVAVDAVQTASGLDFKTKERNFNVLNIFKTIAEGFMIGAVTGTSFINEANYETGLSETGPNWQLSDGPHLTKLNDVPSADAIRGAMVDLYNSEKDAAKEVIKDAGALGKSIGEVGAFHAPTVIAAAPGEWLGMGKAAWTPTVVLDMQDKASREWVTSHCMVDETAFAKQVAKTVLPVMFAPGSAHAVQAATVTNWADSVQ